MSRPQVIDDQEHERVHDRVAAIDVAKDTGMVCTRGPHPSRPGSRQARVWTVKARMGRPENSSYTAHAACVPSTITSSRHHARSYVQ